MNPDKLFARLAAQGPSFCSVTPASTSGEGITALDVAHGCAGLPAHVWATARYILAGDESSKPAAELAAVMYAQLLATERKWNLDDDPGILIAMGKLAIRENCLFGVCRSCNGSGQTRNETVGPTPCLTCEGTGRERMDEDTRARELGLPVGYYRRRCAQRYDAVYEGVRSWLNDARRWLARKMVEVE